MLIYIARRLGWTVVLPFVISLAAYVTFFELPVNRGAAGRRTGTESQDLRRAVPLTGNVLHEYGQFVWGIAARGDLGRSFRTREDVATVLRKAAPATGSLLVGGLLLTLLIALPIGALSALRSRSLIDKGGMVIALLGISIHPVTIGLGLSFLLGHELTFFPLHGYCDVFSPATGCGGPRQWAFHLARRRVADELEQAPVRVVKVDADTSSAAAVTSPRPRHDCYPVPREMGRHLLGSAGPHEAEVAVPRHDAVRRHEVRRHPGPVDVELLVAEAVRVAVAPTHDLGADDVPVEGVRAHPVRDGDDDVVEPDGHGIRS